VLWNQLVRKFESVVTAVHKIAFLHGGQSGDGFVLHLDHDDGVLDTVHFLDVPHQGGEGAGILLPRPRSEARLVFRSPRRAIFFGSQEQSPSRRRQYGIHKLFMGQEAGCSKSAH